ncbi:MAG: hypothetical protein KAS07_03705 [Candidatus Pacebacteria bacterium]|nr:hypothetical protein [Candidatus Paceibacterota bacterium]
MNLYDITTKQKVLAYTIFIIFCSTIVYCIYNDCEEYLAYGLLWSLILMILGVVARAIIHRQKISGKNFLSLLVGITIILLYGVYILMFKVDEIGGLDGIVLVSGLGLVLPAAMQMNPAQKKHYQVLQKDLSFIKKWQTMILVVSFILFIIGIISYLYIKSRLNSF